MINPDTTPLERATARAEFTTAAPYRLYDRPFGRISWGAVFAGAIIALATQLVLTLIGVAIGLATLSPATGESPSGNALGAGAGIWLVVSSLISLFLGGYIAGRLGGTLKGWLIGQTTWGNVVYMTNTLLYKVACQSHCT